MNLSINGTHASREMILHLARRSSMNVPEETFFRAARFAPGYSVLYRWIVLSAGRSYKISGDCTLASSMTSLVREQRCLNYLILPTFTWFTYVGDRVRANGNCMRIKMRAFVVTDQIIIYKIAQFGWVTAILLLNSLAEYKIPSNCKIICRVEHENAFVSICRKKYFRKMRTKISIYTEINTVLYTSSSVMESPHDAVLWSRLYRHDSIEIGKTFT